jgi:hypothetical protein
MLASNAPTILRTGAITQLCTNGRFAMSGQPLRAFTQGRAADGMLNRSKAPDRPAPMLAIASKLDELRYIRRSPDRPRPERLSRHIAFGHRNFPVTWILRQDLADRLRRHAAAAMFSRHEKFRHVVLDAAVAAGAGVDQSETGQPLFHADQQRTVTFDASVAVKAPKWRIAALIIELQVFGSRRLHLREVVNVELREALDQRPLGPAGQPDADDFGVRSHHGSP